jgi:hypothetical protein
MRFHGILAATLYGFAATGSFASEANLATTAEVETDARSVVTETVPRGHSADIRISDLRTYRFVAGADGDDEGRAVCGMLDFRSADEGSSNFVVLYVPDQHGRHVRLDEPFFYGPTRARGGEWDDVLAEFCDGAEERVQQGRDVRLNAVAY